MREILEQLIESQGFLIGFFTGAATIGALGGVLAYVEGRRRGVELMRDALFSAMDRNGGDREEVHGDGPHA